MSVHHPPFSTLARSPPPILAGAEFPNLCYARCAGGIAPTEFRKCYKGACTTGRAVYMLRNVGNCPKGSVSTMACMTEGCTKVGGIGVYAGAMTCVIGEGREAQSPCDCCGLHDGRLHKGGRPPPACMFVRGLHHRGRSARPAGQAHANAWATSTSHREDHIPMLPDHPTSHCPCPDTLPAQARCAADPKATCVTLRTCDKFFRLDHLSNVCGAYFVNRNGDLVDCDNVCVAKVGLACVPGVGMTPLV